MRNILIIDDDAENRDMVRARLEQAGYQVHEAKDGPEGLEMFKTCKPDLVLLDVMMPRTDGWHVCRILKADPQTKNIPVIMLTALSQEIQELRGYENGADDFMVKPWDPRQLLESVERLLAAAAPLPVKGVSL